MSENLPPDDAQRPPDHAGDAQRPPHDAGDAQRPPHDAGDAQRPPGDTEETQRMTSGDPLGATPPPPPPPPGGGGPESPGWTPPPPPGGAPQRGRLVRLRSDRMIAGVASGLGRYFNVDPVIVRIALVVLTFFGGAGLLLYIAAVLLVPSEEEVYGAGGAPADGPAPDRTRGLLLLLAILVAAPLVIGFGFAAGGLLVPLAFLVLVGLAVTWMVTGTRPEREPAAIVRATFLGLGIVVLLAALATGAFWAAGVGGETLVAIVVIAAGVSIVVGAFVRPMRWLVLPALAIALPAAFVSAAGIDLHGGYGDRTYRPLSAAGIHRTYELAAGQITLDLRRAALPPGDHRVAMKVGMGEAVVIVPEDVCVTTDATIGAGKADVFDRGSGGVNVDWVDPTTARPAQPRLVLDADIGLGHLDVRKTEPAGNWHFSSDGDGTWSTNNDRGINDACAR